MTQTDEKKRVQASDSPSVHVEAFFDDRTSTLTYVVFDPESHDAVVIDPVLDYEPRGSKIFTESVDRVIKYVRDNDLRVHLILETHAHADHLSGSQALRRAFPYAKTAIGARITEVQELFKERFDLPEDFPTDGRQFDMLLDDGETVEAGTLSLEVIPTPGHTPACVTYQIPYGEGLAIFTGDALFMPDQGTGRCDFPGGSASDLYDSVTRLYELPAETRVFVGHDYQPGGRDVAWESTVAEQRASNVQLPADISKEDFIERRETRDASLDAPKLLFQSIQVNIDAGRLPEPGGNKTRYLKIPLNVFGLEAATAETVDLDEV